MSVGDGNFGITCDHCILSNEQMYISFDLKNKQKISNIKKDRSLDSLDLAVFSIDHSHSVETTTNDLEIGEECFLVGYPMKIAQMNAAHSYVFSFFDDNGTKLIRIDSSVNQGNSGGPLFDMEGNLLGIINAKHGNLS